MKTLSGTVLVISYSELDDLVKEAVKEFPNHSLKDWKFLNSRADIHNDTWDFYDGIWTMHEDDAALLESGEEKDFYDWDIFAYLRFKGLINADHVALKIMW